MPEFFNLFLAYSGFKIKTRNANDDAYEHFGRNASTFLPSDELQNYKERKVIQSVTYNSSLL